MDQSKTAGPDLSPEWARGCPHAPSGPSPFRALFLAGPLAVVRPPPCGTSEPINGPPHPGWGRGPDSCSSEGWGVEAAGGS